MKKYIDFILFVLMMMAIVGVLVTALLTNPTFHLL